MDSLLSIDTFLAVFSGFVVGLLTGGLARQSATDDAETAAIMWKQKAEDYGPDAEEHRRVCKRVKRQGKKRGAIVGAGA